ncbi:glycoside hydrolase family 2 TIM barrel-domain containing protein [Pinibacter soli]|uniref:Glycoside hydrolase family 2 TIM barrel-domain containing protein n=1 Tax=Pinibacter soli TaxID=3044211 RepID=A0ABT6RF23_9BACT|nr:glycoside hydrolase family 2 TIM barrel-domain containing protein [Pinibacter soli]MDI3321162.1 glycoside hydrolase family 2 TIM barrel-domain containing protein [Pinibacter soli]
MKIRLYLLVFISIIGCANVFAQANASGPILFDDDWLFWRGGALGGEKPDYRDGDWRKVSLPHDWSIEDMPGTNSPFSPYAISQVSGGFTTGGTAWYRKKFFVAKEKKDQQTIIQFDGVYMNADVWLNGKRLGNHPYGYTSFWFDITSFIKPDTINIIAVRVKNEGENSRWYSGSGIYRHVWLQTFDPVHVSHWETFVTTLNASEAKAAVKLSTIVKNETKQTADIRIVTKIYDNQNREVAQQTSTQQIAASAELNLEQQFNIDRPKLWSVESPVLYKAVVSLFRSTELINEETTSFGVRTISFDVTNGFQLNGKTMKLKGGCMHHDNGPLGAAAYDRAEERKIELLKTAGYNAIRTSHNPPSPALLNACDRLGMLVLEEAFDMWREKKNTDDYHRFFDKEWKNDIESMVKRDRNHPSIIMWSTGNEIPNRDKPEVAAVSKMLTEHIHSLDATRPVTCGVNGVGPDKDSLFATMDVAGYNYAVDKYETDHQRVPKRVMYASESFAIDALNYWNAVEKYPWVIGDFVWTAYDYIGEASIGWLGYPQRGWFYPWNLAYCGDIDVCGWKRPQSYYRDAIWKNGTPLSIFVAPPTPTFPDKNPGLEKWSTWDWQDVQPSWSWKGSEGKLLVVRVYSDAGQIELFLNGKSLGKKYSGKDSAYTATWHVPYTQGTLKAVAYNGSVKIAETQLQTAGVVSQIKMQADRNVIHADGQDLSYVTVELTDAKGVRNFGAEDLLKFSIKGGTIIGVGNANPKSVESCQQPQRKAWQGRCLVIVKASKQKGDIVLKARSGVLKGEVKIAAQ